MRFGRAICAAIVAALPCVLGLPALAQTPDAGRARPPRIYNTQPLTGKPPSIDGHLDDEAWKEGEWAGDYVQQTPVEGGAPSQKTELKILYDDKNIYFAIRAYDDMARIAKYSSRRDEFTGDIVGVCFDSYFDKRTGFEFDITVGRHEDGPGAVERGLGHDMGRRVGRQGGARAERLDRRVPDSAEPVALQPAGRADLGHARVAVDQSLPGREPVEPHPAARHRAPLQLR